MIYRVQTSKPMAQALQDLEASIARNGFGLLHSYDFKQILTGKGFPLQPECRVLEICNPRQASEVLAMDMALNMVLPCRVSLYEDQGKTWIAMVPPTDLLALVSSEPAVAPAAAEVERAMRKTIDESA